MGVGTMKDLKLKLMDLRVPPYTGLHRELEHLNIEMILIGESFVCVITFFIMNNR